MTLTEHLLAYAQKKTARFHMPGHKGVLRPPFDGVAPLDVTELEDTGDLYYETDGVLRASERAMAKLYGASACFYLTCGATQGVMAMMSAALSPGQTVYVERSCHRSVYNALAILDLRPVWLWRERLEPWGVNGRFIEHEQPVGAVICTSPDYYGVIAAPPKTQGLVLCDAAHGAHLPFLPGASYRSIFEGCSLWTVSAHKTLGALGQTACLFSNGAVSENALREATAVFGTASPSFALLSSLDAAREETEQNGRAAWARVAEFSRSLAARDSRILSALPEGLLRDPAKLTVFTGDGHGDARRLKTEFGTVCEMSDARNLVFMLSPHNTDEDFLRLERALASIAQRKEPPPLPEQVVPNAVMLPHEAFFAPKKQIPLRDAAGHIAARVYAPFAPGVPVFAPGEQIDKNHLEILRNICYTGDEHVWVVA